MESNGSRGVGIRLRVRERIVRNRGVVVEDEERVGCGVVRAVCVDVARQYVGQLRRGDVDIIGIPGSVRTRGRGPT